MKSQTCERCGEYLYGMKVIRAHKASGCDPVKVKAYAVRKDEEAVKRAAERLKGEVAGAHREACEMMDDESSYWELKETVAVDKDRQEVRVRIIGGYTGKDIGYVTLSRFMTMTDFETMRYEWKGWRIYSSLYHDSLTQVSRLIKATELAHRIARAFKD